MDANINYRSKFVEVPVCLFEVIYGVSLRWALGHYANFDRVIIPLSMGQLRTAVKVSGVVRVMVLTNLVIEKNSVVSFTETEARCFLED